MVERLTSAAQKAARIRVELKAMTMQKLASPKVFSSDPVFSYMSSFVFSI